MPGRTAERLTLLWRVRPRILPQETRRHLRNAARENILAVRSLLDAAIKRSERRGRRRTAAESARTAAPAPPTESPR